MVNPNQASLNSFQQRLRVIPFIWRWLGAMAILVVCLLSSFNLMFNLLSLGGDAEAVCGISWGVMVLMHYVLKPVTADETVTYWSERKMRRREI